MSNAATHRHCVRMVMACGIVALIAMACIPFAGAASNRPYYDVARNLWLSEAQMVSGALQNVPLVAAVHDLEIGRSMKGADVDGYASAIATINAFERIPLTSETPSQMRASHRAWATLNAFFEVTPTEESVLDHDVPAGASYNAAQRAWQREPSGIRWGISKAMVESVIANVRAARAALPARAIIYQAALVDARSLAQASASDIAATTSNALLNPYTQDIYYLNVFFRADQLQVSTSPG